MTSESGVETPTTYATFGDFTRRLYAGPDLEIAVGVGKQALVAGTADSVVVFDDRTGDRTELAPSVTLEHVRACLHRATEARPAGPGRPKLGVVAREITLLPRHWEWLNAQPGGASAAVRRLVDEARKRTVDGQRQARDAAYKFMSVVAGDRPHFEEASRALYAGRFDEVLAHAEAWPADLRTHLSQLLALAASRPREADARTMPKGGCRPDEQPVKQNQLTGT